MNFLWNGEKRLGLALAACMMLLCGVDSRNAACAQVKSTPDVVIYNGVYPGWPSITSTPSGELLCVWREGYRHEYSSDGKVMLSTSSDGGHTWSAATTIQDEALIDDRNTAITALSDDNWLLAYTAYDGTTHQGMTKYTIDGGKSWSTPVAIDNSYQINGTRGAPIKLSSGELLLPFSRGPLASHQSLAAVSSDNGQSWTTYEVPNAAGFKGNEWSVVEMPDSTLVGVIRTDVAGSDGSLWLTKSTDMGHTWSTPEKTNLRDTSGNGWKSPGQIFLHDGKPWVIYDDERYVSVAIATTDDPDMLDWNVDEQIEAYQYTLDGDRIADTGYPWSVAVVGDQRLIVDYYINNGTRQIVGYYATMPTPEPGTLAMLAAAGVFAAAYVWRKSRRDIPFVKRNKS